MKFESLSERGAGRRRLAGWLLGAASLIGLALAPPAGAANPPARAGTAPAAATPPATPAARPVVLILGDSLSAEYGIARGTGWVALLARQLEQSGRPHRIVNASISGETTAGGRARIDDLLARHSPAVVVVELGGNDALRGLDLDATERNLREIVARARAAGARALVLGMMVPPNYGRAYADRFAGIFRKVASSTGTALVPFFLDGVALDPEMFQRDRIHPNERAQPRLLRNVWPSLTTLL